MSRPARAVAAARAAPASLLIGATLLLGVLIIALIGPLLVQPEHAGVGSFPARLPPSLTHLLGTDTQGRELATILVLGIPESLKIGIIAGLVGVSVGMAVGLIAGYFGGPLDGFIRVVTDTLITVPAIAILVVVAANVDDLTVEMMGVIVGLLAWMFAARTIRAQVLSTRAQTFILLAKANGEPESSVIVREVMPHLLPYAAALFVGAVAGGMLAALGLEVLGLGPRDTITLGTIIYQSQQGSALIRGYWWWWGSPIAVIAVIFVGLFLVTMGLDRYLAPRSGGASSGSR